MRSRRRSIGGVSQGCLRAKAAQWRERRRIAREIDEELRFHLDALTREGCAVGLTPRDARREARLRLGDRERLRRECWEARTGQVVPRGEPRRLALGTAGMWATAALLPVLLTLTLIPRQLRPLPFEAPEDLRVSAERLSPWERSGWGERSAETASFRRAVETIGGMNRAIQTVGLDVETGFFDVLGSPMAHGGGFSVENARAEIVLSKRLAEALFKTSGAALGRRIEVGGRPFLIVGVASSSFWFLDPSHAFWLRPAASQIRFRPASLLLRLGPEQEPPEDFVAVTEVSRRAWRSSLWVLAAALGTVALLGLIQTASLVRVWPDVLARPLLLLRNYVCLLFRAAPSLATLAVVWAWVAGERPVSSASEFGGVWLLLAAYVLLLLALVIGWRALVDQRLRCAICQSELRMPVELGIVGSVLFDSPGTEYVCTHGHGALYVPAPTSEGLRERRWRRPPPLWEELWRTSPAPGQ